MGGQVAGRPPRVAAMNARGGRVALAREGARGRAREVFSAGPRTKRRPGTPWALRIDHQALRFRPGFSVPPSASSRHSRVKAAAGQR